MSVRTESRIMRVAPGEEQDVVDFMQNLFWNLLSTQEIKTSDNFLERKNDEIYQRRSTEHYIKLAFHRYLDTPHLDKIRSLENEYFALPEPVYPKLFPGTIWAWIAGYVLIAIGLLSLMKSLSAILIAFVVTGAIWGAYYAMKYEMDKDRADREAKQLVISRKEVLERLKHIEALNA